VVAISDWTNERRV